MSMVVSEVAKLATNIAEGAAATITKSAISTRLMVRTSRAIPRASPARWGPEEFAFGLPWPQPGPRRHVRAPRLTACQRGPHSWYAPPPRSRASADCSPGRLRNAGRAGHQREHHDRCAGGGMGATPSPSTLAPRRRSPRDAGRRSDARRRRGHRSGLTRQAGDPPGDLVRRGYSGPIGHLGLVRGLCRSGDGPAVAGRRHPWPMRRRLRA